MTTGDEGDLDVQNAFLMLEKYADTPTSVHFLPLVSSAGAKWGARYTYDSLSLAIEAVLSDDEVHDDYQINIHDIAIDRPVTRLQLAALLKVVRGKSAT